MQILKMNNNAIAAHISNKNEFIALCHELNIPTLETYPCYDVGDFVRIKSILNPSATHIVKPLLDRVQLDDQRRRFLVCESGEDLEKFVWEEYLSSSEFEGFQIQQYVDFRKETVKYYNVTFNAGEYLTEYLTTEQIINVSAIHKNIQSVHWGNASPSQHHLLGAAEAHARRLAEHYYEIGYRGEIGIDFGLREKSIFFLETNARVNNGTRLYYALGELGLNPRKAYYLLVLSELVDHAAPIVSDLFQAGKIVLHEREDRRTLLISQGATPIEIIHNQLNALARACEPLPY